MAYATLAELRDWVGIPAVDTTDDSKLTLALDAASALIDAYTGQYFTPDGAVATRDYVATDTKTVEITPVSSATGLIVATDDNDDGVYETTWAATDYRLAPPNAPASGRPWTRLVAVGSRNFPAGVGRRWPGVRVTAKGGWPAVPPAVKQATLIQAAFLWGRKDSRFGVAGSPEFGNEMRVETSLDRTAQALLRSVRRQWWVLTSGR